MTSSIGFTDDFDIQCMTPMICYWRKARRGLYISCIVLIYNDKDISVVKPESLYLTILSTKMKCAQIPH
jgi:hypothetical protein